jgi:hypothetical protein
MKRTLRFSLAIFWEAETQRTRVIELFSSQSRLRSQLSPKKLKQIDLRWAAFYRSHRPTANKMKAKSGTCLADNDFQPIARMMSIAF